MNQENYKAPWKHEMSKNGGYFEITDSEGILLAEVDFYDKFSKNFTRPLCTQRKAAEHAAIMTAAPEMLEALIECSKALRANLQKWQYKDEVIMLAALEKAQSVIKKAKGQLKHNSKT